MQGNENIAEYGKNTRFQKGVVTNPAGRPPDKIKRFLKKINVTKADIDAIYDNLLWDYTQEQLRALLKKGIGKGAENPKYLQKFANGHGELAAGITAIISGIMHDHSRGDLKAFNSMIDRRHGKPEKTVNHEIGAISAETLAKLGAVFVEKPNSEPNEKKPRTKRN